MNKHNHIVSVHLQHYLLNSLDLMDLWVPVTFLSSEENLTMCRMVIAMHTFGMVCMWTAEATSACDQVQEQLGEKAAQDQGTISTN